MPEPHRVFVFELTFFGHVLSDLHTFDVVRGDEEHVVFVEVLNDMRDIGVVALVSVLDTVPDWGLVAVFLSKLSFFVHVGSSDELKAKVVSELLGSGDLERYKVCHSLKVALVTIHDNMFVSLVILMGHLLTERLNCSLHKGLLGIYIEQTVSLVGKVSKLIEHSREGFEYFEVLVSNSSSAVKSDLL